MANPTNDPVEPDVQVPIAARALRVTADDFDAAAQQLGLVSISAKEAIAMKTIGLYVEQEGAIPFTLGRAMVNKSKVEEWLDVLQDVEGNAGTDAQMRVNCANVASNLIGKLLENDKNITKLLELLQQRNESQMPARQRNPSFRPGEPVVALQVNLNQGSIEKTVG